MNFGTTFSEEVPLRPSLPHIVSLSRQVRRALIRRARKTRDLNLSNRFLIIVLLSEGHSSVAIERCLKVARAHVSRTAQRYQASGEAGVHDRREENGTPKVDDRFLTTLSELLERSPGDCGWQRSTWSRHSWLWKCSNGLALR